jgi:ABC-type glycerol-3-phosphate transport system permease component
VAQLKSIPSEIYEAAKVDGASPLRIAASVQLPLIRPALVLSVVFSIIGTLQLFVEPLVLRTVAPAIVTEYTPNLSAYNNAFAYNDYGVASAEAVIIAVAAFVLSFGFLAWMAPALVTVFLFQLVGIWNNFLLPLIMLADDKLYPITLGLNAWRSQVDRSPRFYELTIGGLLVSVIPLAIAMVFLQRHWRGGLTDGSVKG